MTEPGRALQQVVQIVAQRNYHLLTWDKVQAAKRDLKSVVRGVVGAEADNVQALRRALQAAEDKNWTKLELLLVDAQIDYTTLMKQYRKGYAMSPRTVQSKQFTGVHELLGIPENLESLSRTSVNEEDTTKPKENDEQDRKPFVTFETEDILMSAEQNDLIKKQQEEIDNLKERLSKLSGQKLKEKNPMIADLSDRNRPTNLAERFSELYDNEWTNALADLHLAKEDHKAGNIKLLADILEASFQYCKTMASDQFQDIWEKTVFPMKEIPEWLNVPQKIQQEAARGLKQYRKDYARLSIPALQLVFSKRQLSKLIDAEFQTDHIINYANRCIELCWLFNVQDPPLCLLWAQAGQRVSEHLKVYKKKGTKVAYNVWPSLLLYQGGPLLRKGVVQPH